MIKEPVNVAPKTQVVGKEYSPLTIRRYSVPVLFWCALITDDGLDELDEVVTKYLEENEMPNSIQGMRDWAGELTEVLANTYKKSEGVGVVLAADKMLVSSLYGDFMNHLGCRLELYSLINTSNLL